MKKKTFRIGSKNVFYSELSASFNTISGFLSKLLTEQNNSIGFPLAIKSCLVLHLMINVRQIECLSFLQNLPQRPYEYVDAALNIILLVLNHTCPDNISDRFECDSNERLFLDFLSIDEKGSLQQAIIRSHDLFSILNEIIEDETKFYPFCTVKAFTILSELDLDTVLEGELIDMVERRTVDQIDEVKASIVKYAGNHLNKYFGTMNEANVIRTLTKLREMSAPDGSDELRCTVSLVVSKMQRKWSSVASLLLFGDIVLLLLRDECSDVRDTISHVVQCLRYSNCEASAVLPSLSEEHFIDWLDEQFRLFDDSAEPWSVWTQLIKMQLDRNLTENEEVADEVFDKCEANVFGEVVLVCKKLMKKVHQILTESDLSAKDVSETLRFIESDWPEIL